MTGGTKNKVKKLVCAGMFALAVAGGVREAKGYTVTQLTFEPGYEGEPAWSPDGSKIAFVSDRDGNYEIYVMDANGSNQERLTHSELRDDREPDWSPDGSKIVFSAGVTDNYDIFIMNADGSNKRILDGGIGNYVAPAWRYNEDKILYNYLFWDGTTFIMTIYIINADGSSRTALGTGRLPSWSPDGTKIVFCSNRNGGLRIWMMDHDGGNERPLTADPCSYGEPAWSPNGTKIVFSIAQLDVTPDNRTWFPDLYMIDSDGSNLERLTFDEYEYDWFYWGFLRRSPTWSPDGTKIAFLYRGDIWVMSGFPALAADLYTDGIVNLLDFGVFANCWRQDDPPADIAPDGGDDMVDFLDLAKLSEEWLQTEEWYQP